MFCDYLIAPSDRKHARIMAGILKKSGYSCVGLEVSLYKEFSEEFEQQGIRVLPVIIIEAVDEKQAKRVARHARSRHPNSTIIGRASSAQAFRFFSRDSRVDIVEVSKRTVNLVDRNESLILSKSGSRVGINLSRILANPRNLGWMANLARRIYRYDVPFTLYSAATEWNSVWHPRQIVALFSEWIGYGRYAFLGLAPG